MVYCCVPFCKSSSRNKNETGVSFHEFPVESEVREVWLKRISRKDFQINSNSPSSVVCSLHFVSDDYCSGLKVRILIKGAVPKCISQLSEVLVPHTSQPRAAVNRKRKPKPKLSSLEQKNHTEVSTDLQTETNEKLLQLHRSLGAYHCEMSHGKDPDVSEFSIADVIGLSSGPLVKFGDMWYQIFLWALFSSLFVHAVAAVIAFATLRKHKFGKFFPVFILVMGVLTPLTYGVVSSAAVAFIYRASEFQMAPFYALIWGVGQTVLSACFGFTRVLATL